MTKFYSPAVESILIHTFLETPIQLRDSFLDSVRDLCDTLDQSKYSSTEDINLIIERDKK